MDFAGSLCTQQMDTTPVLTVEQEILAAFTRGGAWYDFDPLLLDETGNGHDLTNINATAQDVADGKPLGCAAPVAASLQGFTALDAADLRIHPANGLTVFAFVRRNGGGAVFRVATRGNVSSPATHEWTLNYNNASRMAFSIGNGAAIFTVTDTNVSIADLTWYFVAAQVVPAANIIRINVDMAGWVALPYTGTALASTNTLRVCFDSTGRYWNGKIDTLGIAPEIFTDEMLTRIRNGGAGAAFVDF